MDGRAKPRYALDEAIFYDPLAPNTGIWKVYGFAFNRNLSGRNYKSVRSPERTVLVFEGGATGRNASEIAPDISTRSSGNRPVLSVVFLDGHVRVLGAAKP